MIGGKGPQQIIFPDSPGPYTAGYRDFDIAPDPLSSKTERPVHFTAFYPSHDSKSLDPYPDIDAHDQSDLGHALRSLRIYRNRNAKPIDEPCPVIFFEPGTHMAPENYVSILCGLASYGYIVVGMTHKYEFKDQGKVTDLCKQILFVFDFLCGLASYGYVTVGMTHAYEDQERVTDLCKQDTLFVFDFLSKDPHGLPLNLESVGVLGHSLGGIVAQKLIQEPQFQAAAFCDPPKIVPIKNEKPHLYLFAPQEKRGPLWDDTSAIKAQHKRVVEDGGHESFSNVAIFKDILPPLSAQDLTDVIGKGNGIKNMESIVQDLKTFFDQNLKP